ncbi:hypothetical protein ABZY31_12665 [Streptomyces sp. NPDC006529]|uniref:hypothetical protein n=1 Tax=Streptomyces sp. NPDC006529 TaxID=3157177 RepID=UPI0033B4AF40
MTVAGPGPGPGPGSAEPGLLLSGSETMPRQEAEALAIDVARRSTPAEGGFRTFQPVVNADACLLSGAQEDSWMARKALQVPRGNVMFGALLHAADGLRQGEQLTVLEENLPDVLRSGAWCPRTKSRNGATSTVSP